MPSTCKFPCTCDSPKTGARSPIKSSAPPFCTVRNQARMLGALRAGSFDGATHSARARAGFTPMMRMRYGASLRGGFHTGKFQLTRRFGKVAHVADSHTAYLDFDRRRIPRLRPIFSVCRIAGLSPMWIESRRTRRGWHLRIYFRESFSPAELVAIQACCGSDSRREALNLMRILAIRRGQITDRFWLTRWNLLYAEKL